VDLRGASVGEKGSQPLAIGGHITDFPEADFFIWNPALGSQVFHPKQLAANGARGV
jgi:hypothetical protein